VTSPHPTELSLPWAAAAHRARLTGDVAWAPTLPALPDAVADAIAHRHGIRIAVDRAAPDAWATPSFAALFAQARADQVLRAVSARTNLVLAGTTADVAGDGPIADALATALTRIGARVVRVSTDPRTQLRAQLAGLGTAAGPTGVHYFFATGEGHAPLSPGDLTGVIVDASPTGTAVTRPAQPGPARPGVDRDGERDAWVVDIPPPFAADASSAQRRMTDALVTLSLLSGADDLDRAFAEAVLS
jgi:hypothetical protein